MSEGRELTRLVILDGQVWAAGSVPPPEVAERIRNPKCWEPVEDEPGLRWGPEGMPSVSTFSNPVTPSEPTNGIRNLDEHAGGSDASGVIAARTGSVIGRAETDQPVTEPTEEQTGEETEQPKLLDRIAVDDDEPVAEPPRSGKGATEAAWREFATSRDVEVSDDDDRAAIIAACRDAGVIQ